MTEATKLLELARRAEAASAGEQREILEAAGGLICGRTRSGLPGRNFYRFISMLDAEAYESAAMMLVPEGPWWSVQRFPCGDGYLASVGNDDERRGATPALALVAASLRARAAEGAGE